MTRLAEVFLSACIALPVLFAVQDQDVDQLGREAVRFLNAKADEYEGIISNPNDEANIAARYKRLLEINEAGKQVSDKVSKLSPESRKSFNEKYGKDIQIADKRIKAAEAKLGIKNEDGKQKEKNDPKTESPQEITKRIQENMKKANDRLKMNDPGKETVKTQEDIEKDLEELLKQKNPNNSGGGDGGGGSNQGGGGASSSGNSGNKGNGGAPSGGNNGGGANKGGDGGQGGGQDKKDPMANKGQDKQPGGGGDPKSDPKNGGGGGGAGNPKEKDKEKGKGDGLGDKGLDGNLRNPDTKIEEWGQLPKTKRQEMETYARDQFMRRYENDLRQYYRAIAEQSRRD